MNEQLLLREHCSILGVYIAKPSEEYDALALSLLFLLHCRAYTLAHSLSYCSLHCTLLQSTYKTGDKSPIDLRNTKYKSR